MLAGDNNVGVEPSGDGSSNNIAVGGAGGDGGDNNGNNANGGDFNSGDFSGNGGVAAGDNGNGGNGGSAVGGKFGLPTLMQIDIMVFLHKVLVVLMFEGSSLQAEWHLYLKHEMCVGSSNAV